MRWSLWLAVCSRNVGAVVVGVIVAALIFFNYVAAVTRIGAGYVGVEVLLSGSQRGPSEIPIKTGWVFYSPLRSEIIERIEHDPAKVPEDVGHVAKVFANRPVKLMPG